MAKKKDIAAEAIVEARKMQASVMNAAQETLAEALTPAIKKVVTESVAARMNEALATGSDQPSGYDEDGDQKRKGDNLPAVGDTGDDLSDEGDGPAVIEAGFGEGDDEEYSDDDDLDMDGEDDFGGEEDSFGDEEDEEDELEMSYETDDLGDEDGEEDFGGFGDEEEGDEDVIEVVEDSVDDDDDDVEDVEDANESTIRSLKRVNAKLRKENARFGKAVGFLRDKISEVNLFNTRLRAATKLFSNVSLTTEEKNRVIDRLDECESVNEVKRTYKVVKEAYSNASRRPSRNKARRPNTKSVRSALNSIDESVSTRFEELSGIKDVF